MFLTVSGVAAPSAFADDGATSGTSPQGGWGYALWLNGASWERTLVACDQGTADGLRTVAELLMDDGSTHEAHAASGTGSCTVHRVTGLATGQLYNLRACLRNGASGRDVHCGEWTWGFVI